MYSHRLSRPVLHILAPRSDVSRIGPARVSRLLRPVLRRWRKSAPAFIVWTFKYRSTPGTSRLSRVGNCWFRPRSRADYARAVQPEVPGSQRVLPGAWGLA